jgi:hypothetical protein
MNLYEYADSNPIIYIDGFGLWIVNRDNDAKAVAIAEDGDTIRYLANYVALEVVQWRSWVTLPDSEMCMAEGLMLPSAIEIDTEFCPGEEVKIPNTVMAYWAGALGGFGKMWVEWYDDIKRLEKRGFYVPEVEGLNALGLESKIESLQESKELHGIFAWGHGSPDGFLTIDTGGRSTFSFYSEWQPRYKMGLGIIWACSSGDGSAEENFSSSAGAIFRGHAGYLVPWPFHLFGPRTDEIVAPGAQGTNP